jgi:hypothetical protein
MQMTALKSFRGIEGRIKRGRAFEVATRRRGDELERRGLAVFVPESSSASVIGPIIPNKAAETGPLFTDGGATGVEKPSLSSPAVRAREMSTSTRSKIARES